MRRQVNERVGRYEAVAVRSGGAFAWFLAYPGEFSVNDRRSARARLPAYRDLEEVESIRGLGDRVHIDPGSSGHVAKLLPELGVHRAVERVAGTEQHRVDVPVLLQVFLVEGQLAIGWLRRPQSAHGVEPLGAQDRPGRARSATGRPPRASVRSPTARAALRKWDSTYRGMRRRSSASRFACAKDEKSTCARARAIPVASS